MKKAVILFLILFCSWSGSARIFDSHKLYQQMKLQDKINFTAFDQAIQGLNKIKNSNQHIITLIDFSKPSTEKRFYVLDIIKKKLLFSSVVAHGRNSGNNFATSFSNQNGSHKSSLGFYLTENTYQGKNGYSLVLKGLEQGINDQAKPRAIVVHGATYADPEFAEQHGRLGRSFGCPALPLSISRQVINTIKDGSLLYIYADDPNYLQNSPILRSA